MRLNPIEPIARTQAVRAYTSHVDRTNSYVAPVSSGAHQRVHQDTAYVGGREIRGMPYLVTPDHRNERDSFTPGYGPRKPGEYHSNSGEGGPALSFQSFSTDSMGALFSS